jgi:nitric oxide reductase subunit C
MNEENKVSNSVWTSNQFWGRSAGWVTGFSAVLLIALTFDTLGQISMGSAKDVENNVTKRVPSPVVINHKVTYEYSPKRGHEVPVIGDKEMFFGRDDYSEAEAKELLKLGKLTTQAKNCMGCHTLLGNGSYYAPDLTKAWVDPAWKVGGAMQGITGKATQEEAMAEFLQHPDRYASHSRRMPYLGITSSEAKGVVTFLKHMSSIDTNGFPRNFNKINGSVQK